MKRRSFRGAVFLLRMSPRANPGGPGAVGRWTAFRGRPPRRPGQGRPRSRCVGRIVPAQDQPGAARRSAGAGGGVGRRSSGAGAREKLYRGNTERLMNRRFEEGVQPFPVIPAQVPVIPAQAGIFPIQTRSSADPRLRGDDGGDTGLASSPKKNRRGMHRPRCAFGTGAAVTGNAT